MSETQRILTLLRRGDAVADEEALWSTPSPAALNSPIGSFESIGLEVTPSISGPDAVAEPVVGMAVHRIVQEALTNACRHGEGATVVDAHEADGGIHVSVENRISHALRVAVAGGYD